MASVFKRGGKQNRGGSWYAAWNDHNGKRRVRCIHTTDKATAERIAAKLEADAALRRDGVVDPALDATAKESRRTIEDHLTDYEAKLRAANRSTDHIERTTGFVRTFAAFAGITLAADIRADAANRYAGKLRNDGRSSRTIQAHLTALKSFTRWLSDNHKLPRDPLSSVRKPNPKADRRRKRRVLLADEWRRLEVATLAGPERYGMSGAERRLLYQTALQTGLRSNELRSLTRGCIVANADRPFIVCDAGTTKNRKQARQYVDEALAADLMAHATTKVPAAPLFAMPEPTDVATMLRDDLDEARRLWLREAIDDADEYARREKSDFLVATNHEGGMLDFHALRHTCGAWLALANVQPKLVQTIMRHGSISLTFDTYGHLFPGQEADAAARLHVMLRPEPTPLRATGTDNARIVPFNTESAQRLAQRAGRETMRRGEKPCDDGNPTYAQEKTRNAKERAGLCEHLRTEAERNENRPGVIRTHDQGIMSPLL
jgi:integrase